MVDAIALMFRDGALLRRAMIPALIFVGILALLANADLDPNPKHEQATWWGRFYFAVIASASVSPIIFTRVYARLAARARVSAGFDPAPPYLRGYGEATWESILQLVGLGWYATPFLWLGKTVPGTFWPITFLLFAWASHWSAVEALDAARSAPEQAREEAAGRVLVLPWFARQPSKGSRLHRFRALTYPFTAWGHPFARAFRRWNGELHFMEARPATALGFTLAVALVLLVPVLNLFARPLTVMAAALWLAHDEHADAASLESAVELGQGVDGGRALSRA